MRKYSFLKTIGFLFCIGVIFKVGEDFLLDVSAFNWVEEIGNLSLSEIIPSLFRNWILGFLISLSFTIPLVILGKMTFVGILQWTFWLSIFVTFFFLFIANVDFFTNPIFEWLEDFTSLNIRVILFLLLFPLGISFISIFFIKISRLLFFLLLLVTPISVFSSRFNFFGWSTYNDFNTFFSMAVVLNMISYFYFRKRKNSDSSIPADENILDAPY